MEGAVPCQREAAEDHFVLAGAKCRDGPAVPKFGGFAALEV